MLFRNPSAFDMHNINGMCKHILRDFKKYQRHLSPSLHLLRLKTDTRFMWLPGISICLTCYPGNN